MKKLILTITAVAGASLAAYSQGQVGFLNDNANGYVISSSAGDTVANAGGTYTVAAAFTAELWALSGPTTTTAGLAGLDAYGYLNPADLVLDGFAQIGGNVVGGTGSVSGNPGYFEAPGVSTIPGTMSASTVLAVVCWTGPSTSLAAAISAGANVGILAFVNPVGPASPTPYDGDISTGWNLLSNSPRSSAEGGINDLIMAPVPEPGTLALAGLGGLSLLLMRRRSSK